METHLYCLKLFLQKLLESRIELHPIMCTAHGRAKDLLFLDLALASAIRTTMERGLKDLNFAHPPVIDFFINSAQEYIWMNQVPKCYVKAKTLFVLLFVLILKQEIMFFITLVLENLCMSMVNNEDLIYCTKVYPLSLRASSLYSWHDVANGFDHCCFSIFMDINFQGLSSLDHNASQSF
jgi:hypothetical protein